MITLSVLFLFLALVCAVIAALGIKTGQVSMRDAMYACLICWLIVGAT